MLNELNSSDHFGYKFNYWKVGRTQTGSIIYQLQLFNTDGANLTALYKDIVGEYDKKKKLITVTTISIDSIISYLIESIC